MNGGQEKPCPPGALGAIRQPGQFRPPPAWYTLAEFGREV